MMDEPKDGSDEPEAPTDGPEPFPAWLGAVVGVIAGLLMTPFAVVLAFLAMGPCHGTDRVAIVLFPYFCYFGPPTRGGLHGDPWLMLLQFPAYGLIVGPSPRRKIVAGLLSAIHAVFIRLALSES